MARRAERRACLAPIMLMVVGVRLPAMYAVQQRRERKNRQINERPRTLIVPYKPRAARGIHREAALTPTTHSFR
jgi:hypothetical protein